jgi:hypothetical protein
MLKTTKRVIFRWIHIVFGIPIIGYIYTRFVELPNYASVVRYVALPCHCPDRTCGCGRATWLRGSARRGRIRK